jgi:hypothetical protein
VQAEEFFGSRTGEKSGGRGEKVRIYQTDNDVRSLLHFANPERHGEAIVCLSSSLSAQEAANFVKRQTIYL